MNESIRRPANACGERAGAAALGTGLTRREVIAGAASLAAFASGPALARPDDSAPRKGILVFTKSSGFEHQGIKRKNGALGFAEQAVTDLGRRHNYEITITKDGTAFTPENLAKYDAFLFYTTGDLTKPGTDGNPPMTPEGKSALLNAIRSGKGFIGVHCATDTFHTEPDPPDRSNRYRNHRENADPYVRMIGAEFIKHDKQQAAEMRVVDPAFPGFEQFKGGAGSFRLMEEWYSIKDFSPDLHVLLVQETVGMEGKCYERAPYPATWARIHGRGRVFYTSMGHREDVWNNPMFQAILFGGIAWAAGRAKADVRPNLAMAAPGHAEIPPTG